MHCPQLKLPTLMPSVLEHCTGKSTSLDFKVRVSDLQQGVGVAVGNLVLQAGKARGIVAAKVKVLKAAAVQGTHVDLVVHIGQPRLPCSCPLLRLPAALGVSAMAMPTFSQKAAQDLNPHCKADNWYTS